MLTFSFQTCANEPRREGEKRRAPNIAGEEEKGRERKVVSDGELERVRKEERKEKEKGN